MRRPVFQRDTIYPFHYDTGTHFRYFFHAVGSIAALAAGIENGLSEQALLGVTGSGKTFTMAKVIEKVQKPTLVLAHNKTLAAQLCAEFKEFFPDNAVEYFVSYYDYYQPEAYIPHTDTFIGFFFLFGSYVTEIRH